MIQGDEVQSQPIANELYDTGVNRSPNMAIRYLQRSLNLANRNEKRWPDIRVDGQLGPMTLRTLNDAIAAGQEAWIFNIMNCYQGGYYIARMEEDPTQERFIGWFGRVRMMTA